MVLIVMNMTRKDSIVMVLTMMDTLYMDSTTMDLTEKTISTHLVVMILMAMTLFAGIGMVCIV